MKTKNTTNNKTPPTKEHVISAMAHGALYRYYSNLLPKVVDFQAGKEAPDNSIEEAVYISELWDKISLLEPERNNGHTTLHPIGRGPIETPIKQRVNALNKLSDQLSSNKHDNVVAVLLHLNAATKSSWYKAQGHAIFHNGKHGATEIANWYNDKLSDKTKNPLRTKSRLVKRHLPFGMLRGLKCAAVLIELDFMTNREVVKRLLEVNSGVELAMFHAELMMELRGQAVSGITVD